MGPGIWVCTVNMTLVRAIIKVGIRFADGEGAVWPCELTTFGV